MRRFVPGVDFDALEAENRADYEARAGYNRRLKEASALEAGIVVPPGTPDDELDTADLARQMREAATTNAETVAEVARRERESTRATEVVEQATELERRAAIMRQEAARIIDQIKTLPPTAPPADIEALGRALEAAAATNRAVAQKGERERLRALIEELETKSEAHTIRMEEREAAKREAIAAAQMPVPDITFGDGVILKAGVPFDQASDAEKLRASVAIAMAGNPKLRVVRIRDGSLLDSRSLRLIAEMAQERDYQVWLEAVDESGKIGFVIEDGHLKEAE